MPDDTQVSAALFGRQSKDKTKSVDQQLDLARVACAEQGWRIGAEYREGVSASRFGNKVRDGWALLVADVDARRAGVVVLWESSRGDRTLESWAAFLSLCRERGCLIHVITHKHTYDVRIARDWKTLADEGVSNAYASEETSERLRRDQAAAAVAGKPHGWAADGFLRRYDPETRELIEQYADPERAPIIREIITRISKSEPIVTIERDLNARGVPTATGKRWGRTTLRYIANNVAYIGKRRHNGKVYDGTWPALVDETTFWRAKRVLSAPERKTTRPGRARYLMSHRLLCGLCPARCQLRRREGARGKRPEGEIYTCGDYGHVSLRREFVDAFVTEIVVERLSRDDAYAALAEVDDALALAAEAEAVRLRARLDEFRDRAADGDLTAESLARVEKRLLPQIDDADRRARDATVPPVLRELVEPSADVERRFAAMPLAAQRQVVDLLMVVTLLPPSPAQKPVRVMTPDKAVERIHVEARTNGGTSAAGCRCYRCEQGGSR